jgi:hypothetical protein
VTYGSSDLAFMLADMGEVVTFGAYTCRALLNHETDLQDMGGQMAIVGDTISIEYATTSLPGLKKASAITAAGTSYKVREIHKKEDGALSVAFLELP